MEEYFKKCVGRILQSLEVAGIENAPLKDQVKKYIWLLKKDLEQSQESEELNGKQRNFNKKN